MNRFRYQFFCGLGLIIVLLTLNPILHGYAKEEPVQIGEIIYAHSSGAFGGVGGDPATDDGIWPLIAEEVCDSLVSADTEGKRQPSLAKSWKIKEDWSFIDFFLRDDVKFHNGELVTPEDVKYSLETYMRPELKFHRGPLYRRLFKKIELGPKRVRIYLNEPYPALFTQLYTNTGIFPEKYREKVGDKGFADKPIGSGPFRFIDYKQDVYIQLEAVKKHFRTTPEYKTLKVLYVVDPSTRLAMLKSGEADIVSLIGPHIPMIKSDPNLRVIFNKHMTGSCFVYCDLVFPNEPSPFHDIRVRKAASLAINRKAICEKILFGRAEPWGEVFSPITAGLDSSIRPDPYDPEAAKKLLVQAGYSAGFDTVISTSSASTDIITAIASNLKDVGINAKIDLYEGATLNQAFWAKKLHGLTMGNLWFYAVQDPSKDAMNFFVSKVPWCYYTTPEIEKAVEKAKWAISEGDMVKSGRALSKLIRESWIRMPLWSNHSVFGANQRIDYYQPTLGAPLAFEFARLKK